MQAVVQLLPIGDPYQYNENRNDYKKKWFNFNQGFRLKYSKLFPSIIKEPVKFQLQDEKIPYSQILKDYNATSRNMALIAATGVTVAVGGLVILVRLGGKLFVYRSS